MTKDKTIYRKCYFYIESGYIWGVGHDEQSSEIFRRDIKVFLAKHGFEIDEPADKHYCITGTRGNESLYCHPQDLVGYIAENNITALEADLKSGIYSFKYRNKNISKETYTNFTEEELREYMEGIAPKLENSILEAMTTKRKNLFKDFRALENVREEFVKFIKPLENKYGAEKKINSFFYNYFNQMIGDGKIQEAKNKHGNSIYKTVKQS